MIDRFEALTEQVERQFRRASSNVSYRTKQYANYRLTQITPDLQRISRTNAYQDYLIDHIQKEKERFQLYKRYQESTVENKEEFLEKQYYDEFRENPVCTCGGKHAHKCPLKRGKLPREVTEADDIDDGIRQFRSVHNGRPLVLLDAQDDFASYVGEVEHELRDLIAVLATDEIPEDAEWPGARAPMNGQTAD